MNLNASGSIGRYGENFSIVHDKAVEFVVDLFGCHQPACSAVVAQNLYSQAERSAKGFLCFHPEDCLNCDATTLWLENLDPNRFCSIVAKIFT